MRPATPLSRDTSADVQARQFGIWQAMSTSDRAALMTSTYHAVRSLALAGIRARHPDASDDEVFLRWCLLTLGRDAATKAFPAAADLS